MVRKILGKNQALSLKHIVIGNNKITDKIEIANLLAENYSENSEVHGNQRFKNITKEEEKLEHNFSLNNLEHYNKPINMTELRISIEMPHTLLIHQKPPTRIHRHI